MSHEAEGACYLVEWYGHDLVDQSLADTVAQLDAGICVLLAEGSVVRRLMTIVAPTDEVLYSVFAAASSDAVTAVCQLAGFQADRLTAAVASSIGPAQV